MPAVTCCILLLSLFYFYITSDTKLINVWMNSNYNTPLLYKIAGVWGNHQGSMLMLLTFISIAGYVFFKEQIAIKLGALILFSLGFYIFFYANAFTVFENEVSSGLDLNPALQSNYIAIHPPVLYAGYALIFGLWGSVLSNLKDMRILWLSRLCFLTITCGIALGGLWAYQELGWGGFWFWDPVEIVALLLWLSLAAAVHAKNINMGSIIALFSFPIMLFSLTLVRSGVLISVHSFGFDLHNGIWLGFISLMALIISITFAVKNKQEIDNLSIFKEWPVLIFLSFLILLLIVVLLPIKLEASFDESFFQKFINPLILLLLSSSIAAAYVKSAKYTISLALLAAACWCLAVQPFINYLAISAAFVAFVLIFSVLPYLKLVFCKGFVLAHIGIGLCILGASHSGIFEVKSEQLLTKSSLKIAQYELVFETQHLLKTSNSEQERVVLNCNGKKLQPKRSYYNIAKVYKHSPDWVSLNFDNLHASVFKNNFNNWMLELTLKPLINLLWLGLLMVIGGIGFSILHLIHLRLCGKFLSHLNNNYLI